MKALKLFVALVLSVAFFSTQAQDTARQTEKALFYADSLVRSAFYQDWKSFLALSNQSAIKYYGGADGYKDHVITLYFHYEPTMEEKPQTVRVIRMMNNGTDEWQCVLEKVRSTFIENRKARIYSYLVGQSKDDGENWKFVDISQNSVKNVIYILPDIFSTLAIPDGKTIYEDDELAAVQAAAAVAEAPKKTVPKKRPVPAAKKRK